jgi:hypothetical protein
MHVLVQTMHVRMCIEECMRIGAAATMHVYWCCDACVLKDACVLVLRQGAWWDRSVRNFATLERDPVPTVTAHVRASDVEGLRSEVSMYAIWSSREQRLRVVDQHEVLDLTLEPKDSDVLTVAAVQRLPEVVDASGAEAVWAPVGLPAMLNGGAAILSVRTLRGGVRQLKELLKKLAPEKVAEDGAGPSVGMEMLEEMRALLNMLADAEEAGGGDLSRYMSLELQGFDFGALQKLIDNLLTLPSLSSDAESTLQVVGLLSHSPSPLPLPHSLPPSLPLSLPHSVPPSPCLLLSCIFSR